MLPSLTFRSFLEDFAAVPEPRLARSRKYELLEILLLCFSAGVSGYEDWEGIVDFGNAKLTWLRTYLPYSAGIPSHDTVNRVMGLIDVRTFEFALIRKSVLNLSRAIPDKISLQRKRNNCALSDEYRQQCLQI